MDVGKQIAGASSESIYRLAEIVVSEWRLANTSRIADIGGGRGNFATKLLEYFDEVFVVEHEAYDAAPGIHYLTGDLNEKWPIQDGLLDAVVSLEVIEHLENPRHFMREIYRILKTGGLAVVTTPNQLSLSSKLSLVWRNQFRDFSDNCYPAHITSLVLQDLLRCSNEAGLDVTKFRFSDSGRLPFSRLKWQLLSGHLTGQSFSDNVGIILRKP